MLIIICDILTISHYRVTDCIVLFTNRNALKKSFLYLWIDNRCMYLARIKWMANDCFMMPKRTLENRLFLLFSHFLHNVVWGQSIHEWYEWAFIIIHRNYELSSILAYKKFQLLLAVIGKNRGLKMMKNHENGLYRPKSGILWYPKIHDAEWYLVGFFYQRS